MPLDIGYNLGSIQLMAGPYIGYGLGGTEMYNITITETDGSNHDFDGTDNLQAVSGDSVNAGLPNDITGMVPNYFRNMDFGLTFGVGYNFGKLNVHLQYE